MEVVQNPTEIVIYQHKYTLDLLEEIGILGRRLADTPIELNPKLGVKNEGIEVNQESYQCLV